VPDRYHPRKVSSDRTQTVSSLPAERIAAFRLARHGLDPRAEPGSAVELVARLAGVQAQVLSSADLALRVRVPDHGPTGLSRLLWSERQLVKTWLMRGTLHIVAAEDLPVFVAALDLRVRPAFWYRNFHITPDELEALVEAIGDALGAEPMSRQALVAAVSDRVGPVLGGRLASGWGEFLKPAAWRGRLCHGPSEGAQVSFVRPDRWLGQWRTVPAEDARVELARRYVRLNGPVARDDLEWWIGAAGPTFRDAWRTLEPELIEVELKRFMLRADADAISGMEPSRAVRLIPGFDPYLLTHRRRGHLADEGGLARIYRQQGWISPVVLVGGRAVGIWSFERASNQVFVSVSLFDGQSRDIRTAIETEAAMIANHLGGALELSIG
jgi:winged helix DNA-binding protein